MVIVMGFSFSEASLDQPVKTKPEEGVAVRMTAMPIVYVSPPVTVPPLEGLAPVVRGNCSGEKLAMTFLLRSMVIVMGFWLPEASPDQPVKNKPEEGVAVRMTAVPIVYVPPPVTVPPLGGLALMVRGNCSGEKLAMTLLLRSMVIVMGFSFSEASLDQPVKTKPEEGVAVRVTVVPIVYVPPPVTVPPLEGLASVVRVNCSG